MTRVRRLLLAAQGRVVQLCRHVASRGLGTVRTGPRACRTYRVPCGAPKPQLRSSLCSSAYLGRTKYVRRLSPPRWSTYQKLTDIIDLEIVQWGNTLGDGTLQVT